MRDVAIAFIFRLLLYIAVSTAGTTTVIVRAGVTVVVTAAIIMTAIMTATMTAIMTAIITAIITVLPIAIIIR